MQFQCNIMLKPLLLIEEKSFCIVWRYLQDVCLHVTVPVPINCLYLQGLQGFIQFRAFCLCRWFRRELLEVEIIHRSNEKQQHIKTMKCQGTSQWNFTEQVKSHVKMQSIMSSKQIVPKENNSPGKDNTIRLYCRADCCDTDSQCVTLAVAVILPKAYLLFSVIKHSTALCWMWKKGGERDWKNILFSNSPASFPVPPKLANEFWLK